MKLFKYLFLVISATICLSVDAISQTSHIVDRGESIEYIAGKYGVSVEDIRKANKWLDNIYCGLELAIPEAEKKSEYGIETTNPLFTEAESYVRREDYGKAIKIYNKILKTSPNDLTARYNRGVCYYNKGKMKQAAEDFSFVKRRDKNGDFPDAEELADNARHIQNENDARQAQMWGNLIQEIASMTTGLRRPANIPIPMLPPAPFPISVPTPITMPAPMPNQQNIWDNTNFQIDWSKFPTNTNTPMQFNWDNVNFNNIPAGGVDSGGSTTGINNTPPSGGHQCRVCKGTGMEIVETWMGGDTRHWCDICKKDVYGGHRHVPCKTCNNTGWIN